MKPALPEVEEEALAAPSDMAEPAPLAVPPLAGAPPAKAGGEGMAIAEAEPAPRPAAGPPEPVAEAQADVCDLAAPGAEPGSPSAPEAAAPLPRAEAAAQPVAIAPSRLAAADLPQGSLAILRPAAAALGAVAGQLPADTDLRMELTVEAEGIGPIRFIMGSAGDVIRVHLAAQQAEALDLLRRHAADLQAGLQEAGYREAQMSFGDWQGKAPPRPPPVADIPAEAAAAQLPSPQLVAAVAAMRGGLDMRW